MKARVRVRDKARVRVRETGKLGAVLLVKGKWKFSAKITKNSVGARE